MKPKKLILLLIASMVVTGCSSKVNSPLPPAPQDSAEGEAYYASFKETVPGKIEVLRGSLSILEKLAKEEAVASSVAAVAIETVRGLDPPAPPNFTFRPRQDMPAYQTGAARDAGKSVPDIQKPDVVGAVAGHTGTSGVTGNVTEDSVDSLAGEANVVGPTGATGGAGVFRSLPGLHGLRG